MKKDKLNKRTVKDKSLEIRFIIIAVILISIFCIALTPVTFQNDTYYTIKIGEHIVEYGIDMQDPFSWHENLGYTYPHWLYDLLTYLIYSISGFTGIYITTCILSVILGLSIFFVNRKLVKNDFMSFIVTIGAMYLLKPYIAARAQLVTFILFLFTVYFIECFLSTKKIRYAVGLVIIPILIANLHSAVFPFYFVLYLPYIAEYLIACISEIVIYKKIKIFNLIRKIKKLENKNINNEKLENLKKQLNELEIKIDKVKVKRTKELKSPYKIKMEKNKNVKWLILILVICIFTGLLTPLGTTPYTYLFKTMQGNTTQNINEHLPMTLATDIDIICTLIIFLAILIFTKAEIRLCDLFMLGGLCYLMLASRRQVSMFAIIACIILNRLVLEIDRIYTGNTIKEASKAMASKVGLILTTIIMLILSMYFAKDKFDDKFIDEDQYPVKACDFILENVDLGQAKFYNEYNYGSYMLFRGIPVFIDSRADLYSPEFSGKKDDIFMDFINTSSINDFYEDTFEKYGITHVICFRTSKVNMLITKTHDENYNKLYEDNRFIIYERVTE